MDNCIRCARYLAEDNQEPCSRHMVDGRVAEYYNQNLDLYPMHARYNADGTRLLDNAVRKPELAPTVLARGKVECIVCGTSKANHAESEDRRDNAKTVEAYLTGAAIEAVIA